MLTEKTSRVGSLYGPLLARQPPTQNHRQAWRQSYALALTNAGIFVMLSMIGVLAGPDFVEMHRTAAILFGLGSAFAFYRMVMAGGMVAIAFYVFGMGLFFGFGTYLSTIIEDDYVFITFFDKVIQDNYLVLINLMNASSTFIVLFVARTMVSGKYWPSDYQKSVNLIFETIYRFKVVIFIVAGVVLAIQFITFPIPEDLILRGSLGKIRPIILLALVLGASRWRDLSLIEKSCVVGLLGGSCLFGLLSLAKTDAMLPIVAVNVGLFIDRRSRGFATAMGLATVAAYIFIVSPLVANGRYIVNHSEDPDTFQSRVVLLRELVRGSTEIPAEEKPDTHQVLTRFAGAPFQAFLMREFDEGRPGYSLSDFWVALVPRVLWPDKPEVTRFGAELYSIVFNVADATSALAPTYTAEAYWDYGWLGVLVVSVLVGLELGWLSRRWFEYLNGTRPGVGILVFTVPAALFAFWVETWIAATYIGGFVTLVVLIKACDYLTTLRASRLTRRQRSQPVAGRWP